MQRRIPLCILNVIIYWYSNLTSCVKWNDSSSRHFKVTSGVRQGGILSPRIFTMYVDDLLILLRNSGVGCHLINMFVAALMYADDLALIAPTRSSLQHLLDLCHSYGIEWCISYNPSKTKVMLFGPPVNCKPLTLNGLPIVFSDEYKYLGVYVVAGGEFRTSAKNHLQAFYCSSNTILNILHKPSEEVQMRLLYSNCVPALTYACEVKVHESRDMMRMDVAVNDSIRKIFGFQRWESTRSLRQSYGYDSICETYAKRRQKFLKNIRLTKNPILILLNSLLD